jgi:cellobiose transport system permease protein
MSLSVPTAPPPRAVPPPQPRRRPRGSAGRVKLDMRVSPYLYVAPFFIVFGLFGLYPMIKTAYYSLTKFNPNTGSPPEWIGLDNFTYLISDEYFWNSVYNTVGMFLIGTVPQILLALYLATLLNRQLRARTFFRMGVLVPNVTSVAAMAIVFGVLFARDYGIINWFLEFFGVKEHIDWQSTQWPSWTAISVMVDWRWTGYNALIFLAGMQAIPKDLYESASIDGASLWRQFWQITLPMLKPTFVFVIIVSTIGGLQLFTEPTIFGNGQVNGGSTRQFQTVTMYMYEKAFRDFDFGYGSAVAWALFFMIVFAAGVNFALIRRSVK